MFKKMTIIGLLLIMMTPLPTQASTTETIGNFIIKDTHYSQASLLHGNQYYSMLTPFVVEDLPGMRLPSTGTVKSALIQTLSQLETQGVNTESLVEKTLIYEIVNVDMQNANGQAFVAQPTPTIYLYGKYIPSSYTQNPTDTAIHEFGHYIEKKYFTAADRQIYREIRKIPAEWQNQQTLPWANRFEEIFAEDFKTIFKGKGKNRAGVGAMSLEQEKSVDELILSVLKRETNERVYVSDLHEFIVNNKYIFNEELLLHRDALDSFLFRDLTGENMLNWTISYLSHNDPDFLSYLGMMDLPYEMYNSTGLYPTNLKSVSNEDMRKVGAFYIKLVKQHATNQKKETWDQVLQQNQQPKKTLSDIDQSLLVFHKRGILVPSTQQELDRVMTRGEAAHLLYANLELSSVPTIKTTKFKDIPKGHAYIHEIETLTRMGVFHGKTKDSFGWSESITREEMAAVIARAYSFKDDTKVTFVDDHKISANFKKDVVSLYNHGIFKGSKNGYFHPKEKITSSQYVMILNRSYLNTLTDQEMDQYTNHLYSAVTAMKTSIDKNHKDKWTQEDLLELLHSSTKHE